MRAGWKVLKKAAEALDASYAVAGSQQWLLACLRRNAQTKYGLKHGFGSIRDADDYRARVPLVAYDDLAGFVQEIARGCPDILFAGLPAAWELTGGSGGGRRLIPYSAHSLADFRAVLLPWVGSLVNTYGLGSGRAYLAIGPVLRGDSVAETAVPVGLPEGAYLGVEVVSALADISAVPAGVAAAASLEEWRLLTAYHLLRASDLEFVSVWSPTFLLGILEGIVEERGRLELLLRGGGEIGPCRLEADAKALACLAMYNGTNPEVLWPRLKAISCWADASSTPYAERLAALFPHAAVQGKGLLLTEGVVTVPDAQGRPLPVRKGFVEFLDERGRSHLAHELRTGGNYEVAMTTSGGLYRYRAGDVVCCEGFTGAAADDVGGVPILRFAGRCGVCSDLVGEKLTDAFVAMCLKRAGCYGMVIPDRSAALGYVLLTEANEPAAAGRLDEAFCRNPQYAYARKLGQLCPVRARCAEGLSARYAAFALASGRLLGDVKIPALCVDPLFAESFSG